MAKSNSVGDLMTVVLGGGLLFVAYKMSMQGSLGKEAQNQAFSVCKAVRGEDKCRADLVPISNANSNTSTTSFRNVGLPASWQRCVGPYGNYYQMIAGNGNIGGQMEEWQRARARNNENPFDWAAFRLHVTRLSGSDPGPDPVKQFCDRII